MDNKECAHLWANKSRTSAKGSHFYFEGDTIYSYGSHFPIARHYNGVVLFTSKGHSVTTARHKSVTRSACSHLEVFTVADPMAKPSGADVKNYAKNIETLATKAGRARNPDFALQILETEVNEANSFCERFGFKTRFTMPANMDELREKAQASAKREREAKARREAKFVADCAETVAKWLAGESVTIPYQYSAVLLRAQDGDMQTSKSARVPLDEAERAFRFCLKMRDKGWHKNGDTFKVGNYQLDAVNEFGVIAGCHRVAWAEIERFAKSQQWI